MKLKETIFFMAVFSLLVTSPVLGASLEKQCEEGFKKDFPNTPFQEVMESPIKGLCEIHAGVNIFYYQPQAKDGLMMIGQIYTPMGDNLTEPVKVKLQQDVINRLPYEASIKTGDGPVRVVVFTDPDCPYCRDWEKALEQRKELLDMATFHTFLFPLDKLHPQARGKSRWIYCQEDVVKGLHRVMLQGELDKVERIIYPDDCSLNQVEERLYQSGTAASTMAVRGTPTIYVNGVSVSGGVEQKIKAIEAAFKATQIQK